MQLFLCRYRELEEKLDYLQKSSAQRDRTEALLKQKDKDCTQVINIKVKLIHKLLIAVL